jgi:hypothetical protein
MAIEATLFIADLIQLSEGQKMLAVGLYPDRTVVLNHTEPPSPERVALMPSLHLLTTLTGLAPATYRVNISVIGPSGVTVFEGRDGTYPVDGASLNLITRGTPFPIAEIGTYRVVTVVNGETRLENTFEIRFNQVSQPATG